MKTNNSHHRPLTTTEKPSGTCRHCGVELLADGEESRLCNECCWFAADYRRYDKLRAEGHGVYQAKLMAGLIDPPDPDE
ncbi:hypothetical protein [Pseudomonas proteolytica]|uniref:hypothetical protein n=1 Tax=Pseudomonas proteolytica TaxID=219574 RepID=UPI0030D71B29